MSKTNTVVGQPGPPAHQKHITDNLNAQLGVIMVQMGRILKAQVSDQDRADFIVENARKKMIEATDSFHSTLDDMEIEITRAKAVFLRDLEVLRGKHQASQPAVIPAHVAPPAPMVIDLDEIKPTGPAVPVAPMMATGGAPFVAAHGIPKTEGKPVAPFPDMGAPVIPGPNPGAASPLVRVKPPLVDQKRPSPKQTKQPTPKQAHKPAPKSNPASARMANKPNPMASTQKQPPKPPATAPPSAPAVAPAPAPLAIPAALMAPVAAPQPPPPPPQQPMTHVPHFTNATFTLDPMNNDSLMQSAGGSNNLDLPMIDMETFGTGDTGGPGDTGNNDTTMDDLDHFFDMGTDNSNVNADTSDFNNMDEYMNSDFDFDTFQ